MSSCDRRTVLKGAAVTCGAGVLAACGGGGGGGASTGGGNAPPAAAPTSGSGAGQGSSEAIVQLSDVPVGGAVAARAPDGAQVLVARPSEGEAVAFSAVCPHEGCSVAPDDDQFSCPCHGSQFSLSGEVKRGPAQSGLRSYAVQVVDGQVLPA